MRPDSSLRSGYDLVSERPWQQAALFGLTPDATAVGTLGLLVLLVLLVLLQRTATALWRIGPWLLPLLWCAASAATLLTMDMPAAWWMAGGALIALLACLAGPPRGHPH